MKIALMVVFLAVALFHLYACFFKLEGLRKLTKPFLLALLIAIYCVCANSFHWYVVAALALGLVGDILLIFPKNGVCFLLGACSFALGHAFYIHMLYGHTVLSGISPAFGLANGIPLAILFIAAMFAIFIPLMKSLPGAMKVLMPAYIALVCVFAIGAAMGLMLGGGYCIPLLVGSLLFIASDSILGYQVFKGDTKRGNFFVMLTYIAAQALLVLGFILV